MCIKKISILLYVALKKAFLFDPKPKIRPGLTEIERVG
jgi:hypothetical protein